MHTENLGDVMLLLAISKLINRMFLIPAHDLLGIHATAHSYSCYWENWGWLEISRVREKEGIRLV